MLRFIKQYETVRNGTILIVKSTSQKYVTVFRAIKKGLLTPHALPF